MFFNIRRFFLYSTLIVFALALLWLFCPKPELLQYQSYSRAFWSKEGKLLRLTLSDDEKYRLFTPIDAIPESAQEAVILYEDKHFYQHIGVDIKAIVRAFYQTYITRDRRVGASTITMQVARHRWQIESRTLFGKFKQIIRALQLSRHYTKKAILEAYFNQVSYGHNIEGLAAASLVYFGKKPQALNDLELLTLTVIPQNPNKRDPTSVAGLKQLQKARSVLLAKWQQEKTKSIVSETHLSLPLQARKREDLPFLAPHFVDHLNSRLAQFRYGHIDTTLNMTKQSMLERTLSEYIDNKQHLNLDNAAAMILNYETMAIEALVGSANFFNKKILGQVNGTKAKRSPGSTLKPFVYGLALDAGLIHPASLMKDLPARFGAFTPENYDGKFLGPVSAREALIASRNVPAVHLQNGLKGQFYKLLEQAKVKKLRAPAFYGLALSLGGVELSMIELVRLYAMLANGGQLHALRWLQQSEKQILAAKPLLSAEASFLVLDILKDNPPPENLLWLKRFTKSDEVAWKTGTSWAFRDAWAIGVSGQYVVAVWVGDFAGKSNPAYLGRSAAGPLLFKLFSQLTDRKKATFARRFAIERLNIKRIEVCEKTGDLPDKYCPWTALSYFIPGVSPIKTNQIYRPVAINISSGLRACWHEPGKTRLSVFEFWPQDYLRLFKQAGLYIKTPPEFEPGCTLDIRTRWGKNPDITSPDPALNYIISGVDSGHSTIPFRASADSDAKTLYWFIDNQFAGQVDANEVFFWRPEIGTHSVRVVDDSGRSAQTLMRVSLN